MTPENTLVHQLMNTEIFSAEWVLVLLIGLSVLTVAVSLERAAFFWWNRAGYRQLEERVDALLAGHLELERFREEVASFGGVEARVLRRALTDGAGAASFQDTAAAVQGMERKRLERGMVLLATVGSNAPFIGLFGTVLGIIKAFQDLSLDHADSASAVMAGISEALVATAVGLLVAIPAVVLYNLFQRWIRGVLTNSESVNGLVAGFLKRSAVG